tara:strand:- start:3035 stop:3916 length:882 start_codon:yes stop_codon:yes gene_type:complete
MAWIKSEQALASHPKVHLLAKTLGISVPQVIGHLHLLWWWALDYADNGDLTRYKDFIPNASQWDGDEKLYIDSLIEHGFIDVEGNKLIIHDWLDYTGALIETREKDAERKRLARQSKNAKNSANRTSWETTDTNKPSGVSVGRPEDVPSPSNVEKTRLEKTRQDKTNIGNSIELQQTEVVVEKTDNKVIFSALCSVLEYDTNGLTTTARGQLNKASKELAEVGATPHDIEVRAKNFALSFGWKPTPMALVKHWASMIQPQPKLSPQELNQLQSNMRKANELDNWVKDDEEVDS